MYTFLSFFQSQFHRFLFIGAMMLISPLVYIRYYENNHQVALENLGSYCVCLTIIGYGAPLVSLVGGMIRLLIFPP